ncbi:MAG: flagellar basal body-associated FliL family protein, partial [Sphingomonadales bacterium]
KKVVLFGVVPALVIVLIIGAAFMFGLFGSDEEQVAGNEIAEPKELNVEEVVFFDLPEILVTLNSGGVTNYLKIRVALEIEDKEAVGRLEALLPRIVDNFQVYLRELRIDDINGSAGLFRLKEELLIRVNSAVHPVRVNDVLFKEMLVQ